MIALAVAAFILGFWYGWIQLSLRRSWNLLPTWEIPADFSSQIKVAIIIPVRNEAGNIRECLRSLCSQDYPKGLLEIYVVDDHSEDRTVELVESFKDESVKVIRLEDLDLPDSTSPKKRALDLGIERSSAALILTTDGDCRVEPNWVKSMVSYYANNEVDLIAGPVMFEPCESAFERFQALDFVGMMGITGAGIQSGSFHMCNGANLAFSRESFEKVGGYDGTRKIASGDDILLAQKYVVQPGLNIGFVKSLDAIVSTKPISDTSAFIRQRLRWGAKSEHYKEKKIIWIQFVVLLTCLALIAFGLLLIMFYKFHWQKYLTAFSILLIFKVLADYFSLKTYAKFFKKETLMSTFFYAQGMHILYIGFVGVLSVFVRKHTWKGRRLK